MVPYRLYRHYVEAEQVAAADIANSNASILTDCF